MADFLKVLVVDDERMYRTLLQKTLAADENYDVETAENGTEAIKKIDSMNFDIILTDLVMPQVSGIEVLKAAKAKNPAVVVIIITGFASLDTALAAIRDGVYDYITKPFQIDEIRLTVNNARERLLLERESATLAAKLEKAYETIEALSKTHKDSTIKIEEIDQKLASSRQKLKEGTQRLQGFHDRVLPAQFGSREQATNAEAEPDDTVVQRLREATQLHKGGMIDDEEFRLLKRKILVD